MSKPKIAIIYYSMYGHVRTMAEEEKKGLEEAGCEVKMFQVAETLPEEVLGKMHAPPKSDDPVIVASDLPQFDGFLFGLPSRFGMAPAQMKAFMDSTGSLWQAGALVGKPAGLFFSTATQGGGQETVAFSFLTQLTHHGMLFVPLGYTTPLLFDLNEIHGGSPYGAGTYAAGDGSRQPSDLEKKVAAHQGKHFGGIVTKLCKGGAA